MGFFFKNIGDIFDFNPIALFSTKCQERKEAPRINDKEIKQLVNQLIWG
jgi:hypothetical protein